MRLRSASSSRVKSGLSTGFTSRMSPKKTIFPASLPLYLSKSASVFMSTQTAGAVTGPFVAGDHGAACAMKTAVSGEVMRTQVFSCCQPMPNSPQSSRCALAAAHGGELIAGPFVGALQIRRTGQARADAVHEAGGVLHDVRVRESFFANALVHREIERFFFGLRHFIGGPRRFFRSGFLFVFVRGEQGKREACARIVAGAKILSERMKASFF